jgi:hypothetical protein
MLAEIGARAWGERDRKDMWLLALELFIADEIEGSTTLGLTAFPIE